VHGDPERIIRQWPLQRAPHGLPPVTRQLLHSASFGAVVWLLADRPWQAVSWLTFVFVSLVLAGHWAVVLW
jgi:hypothetical protein